MLFYSGSLRSNSTTFRSQTSSPSAYLMRPILLLTISYNVSIIRENVYLKDGVIIQHNNNRVTIKDVANYSNVSIATVSKVINGKDQHISEPTRRNILDAVEHLGYVPNSMAKSLKVSSTKTIGLIIPDISNAFPEMAKGAQDEAFTWLYHALRQYRQ